MPLTTALAIELKAGLTDVPYPIDCTTQRALPDVALHFEARKEHLHPRGGGVKARKNTFDSSCLSHVGGGNRHN